MARSRKMALLAAAMMGPLALVACGGSSKTTATTATTTATTTGGGVTVQTTAAGGVTVNAELGDTKGLDAAETLTLSAASAKAGSITFAVKNTGTIEHEMVVLKTDTAFDQLPITFAGDPPVSAASGTTPDKVDEATSVGETGDPNLQPNDTRNVTLTLDAGKYVLICNIAKHYGLGMRAAFTVTP